MRTVTSDKNSACKLSSWSRRFLIVVTSSLFVLSNMDKGFAATQQTHFSAADKLHNCLERFHEPGSDTYQCSALLMSLDLPDEQKAKAFVSLLSSNREDIQLAALSQLASLHNASKHHLNEILGALQSRKPSETLQLAYTKTIRAIGLSSQNSRALFEILKHQKLSDQAMSQMVRAIGESRDRFETTRKFLVENLNSNSTELQFVSYQTLQRMKPTPQQPANQIDEAQHIQTLLTTTENSDRPKYLRLAAATALVPYAGDRRDVSNAIVEMAIENADQSNQDEFWRNETLNLMLSLDFSNSTSRTAVIGGLPHFREAAAIKVLDQLSRSKFAIDETTVLAACQVLNTANGATNDRLLAAALNVICKSEQLNDLARKAVSGLLSHSSPVFRNRDKLDVIRLRAYAMITLTEIGIPNSSLTFLLETLTHTDERVVPFEIGAAARAVRKLKRGHQPFKPLLANVIFRLFSEEEFSLQRYDPIVPSDEATTVQLEAVRSLGVICDRNDQAIIETLEVIAAKNVEGKSAFDPRVVVAAANALDAIRAR